jgi:hypothetical protein
MTKIEKTALTLVWIITIAILLSGCSNKENVICETNQSLLICDNSHPNECVGFLQDKSIMLIKEENI